MRRKTLRLGETTGVLANGCFTFGLGPMTLILRNLKGCCSWTLDSTFLVIVRARKVLQVVCKVNLLTALEILLELLVQLALNASLKSFLKILLGLTHVLD